MNLPLNAVPEEFVTETIGDESSNAFETIDIEGDVVSLHSFQIRNPDLVAYLSAHPPDERPVAFRRIVEVGVFCLERASTAKDTEFIRRQIDRVLLEMESKVGAIPTRIQEELVKKVGTGDGQVLKPIFDASCLVSDNLEKRIKECRTLFANSIDPTNNSSDLGKALKSIGDLLDPKHADSVQCKLQAAVSSVTALDGALAVVVKTTVDAAIAPLKAEVSELGKEIRGQEAAEEIVQQTTLKGPTYEEEVVELLQPLAKTVGASLERVGEDNRPGDILFTLTKTSICSGDFRLVIEARDRTTPVGRTSIAKDLATKMAERSANAGLYVNRTASGFGRDVCEWCEGECERGPWLATTHEHLGTAIRFLIALDRLRTLRSELPEVDGTAISNQIQAIRTSLKRITTINSKITDIGAATASIKFEAESLRDEIKSALTSIEDAIRQATMKPKSDMG